MSALHALLAYLQGLESFGGQVAARLSGSPYRMRLIYLGGHPGIGESASFWVGRVGDRIRLVDEPGQRWYDMEINRILGITCSIDGHLFVRFEPTPGRVTTVEFQGAPGCSDCYARFLDLLSIPA